MKTQILFEYSAMTARLQKAFAGIAALVCLAASSGENQAPAAEAATQPAGTQTVADPSVGRAKVVGLDYFYNHQVRNEQPFHYIWEDTAVSGYSKFGEVWQQWGASLGKLEKAPTLPDLRRFSVYIIVNPNTPARAAGGKPNYIQPADVDAIESWVKDGGVLALFGNDKNNCEFEHFNLLSQRFGITFNEDLRNEVPNARDRSPGTFSSAQFPDHPLFKDVKMIYMKEICTLGVKAPAKALMVADKEHGEGKDIIMATAQVGKGLVFAVGDPWIYNEYIDVTSPNLTIENRKAANNLAQWLLTSGSAPQAK
jgi:unsaturated rhamnogalacturonyl hydrolase